MKLTAKLSIIFAIIFISSVFGGLNFGFLTEVPFVGLAPKFSTLAQYSGFLTYCFFLLSIEERIDKLSLEKKKILLVFAFLFSLAGGYEMLWHFHYWFSIYSIKEGSVDIDKIMEVITITTNQTGRSLLNISKIPLFLFLTSAQKIPFNIWTKFVTGLFAVAVFTTIFLLQKVWKER